MALRGHWTSLLDDCLMTAQDSYDGCRPAETKEKQHGQRMGRLAPEEVVQGPDDNVTALGSALHHCSDLSRHIAAAFISQKGQTT